MNISQGNAEKSFLVSTVDDLYPPNYHRFLVLISF